MEQAAKARALRAATVLRAHGVTQADVAAAIGASQPQVSRILAGRGTRSTRMLEAVCLYAERLQGGVTTEAVQSNAALIEALRSAWDGSGAHARALAAVIKSLSLLRGVEGQVSRRKARP